MVKNNEIEGKTFLKGIVSSSLATSCSENENQVVIFTDVSKYFKFIKVRIQILFVT
jgi:hypothetical protein